MATAAAPSSWEELPPDLLGLVLYYLPSLADGIRLRAVCRPWRAGGAARRHPRLPPPLPWLALSDGGLVDLHGAPVLCAPVLREGVFGYRAVDNLAFLVHDDGGCSLMNPLSGLSLPLPKLASAVGRALDDSAVYDQSHIRGTYVKVILSSSLLDSALEPLVAAIIMDGMSVGISSCKQPHAISISMRRKRKLVSARDSSSMSPEQRVKRIQGPQRIHDIAFFHGKLYALTWHEGLRVIELDVGHLGEANSSPGFLWCIHDNPEQQEIYNYGNDDRYLVVRYLVESDGRLLMVRRWMSVPPDAHLGDHDRTVRFEVFQADLATAPGQWIKLDSLGGHAIFLGIECSKSVPASHCAGGVQEDSIYFMHQVFDSQSKELSGRCRDPLADSGVYNLRDGKITPLLPEAVMSKLRMKQQFLTWFFPADA
ncbi:unnamed protein product [Urochloa decumbens]|uniref:KIB1-4 beta-propeller domain-containing protein n=1 Tax=Urochloa decumbens TaxID=240449 RepID=A0ABC9C1Y7_9POAL